MTQNDLIPYFTVQQSVEVGFDTSVALPRPSRAAASRLARVTGQNIVSAKLTWASVGESMSWLKTTRRLGFIDPITPAGAGGNGKGRQGARCFSGTAGRHGRYPGQLRSAPTGSEFGRWFAPKGFHLRSVVRADKRLYPGFPR